MSGARQRDRAVGVRGQQWVVAGHEHGGARVGGGARAGEDDLGVLLG
ncbi:hypothetical protein AB0F91_20480 [Amycolatopsis sp. NPDC023774]